MRRTHSLWLAGLAGALMCAPAQAAQAPITGKLSKAGYTVIAVGYHGKAVSSAARAFRIVPREAKVTLQLRDAKGRYAGPVVVDGSATKAVVGVRAGAKLGTIDVLNGYAKTARPARAADAGRFAQAHAGVPLGNGRNFGLVRSHVHGAGGPGADQDRDGIPGLLDIDADGDHVLDNEEGGGGAFARAAQVPQPQGFSVFSQIGAPLERSVNADAAGVTDAAIDQLVQGTTTAPPFQPIGMFLVFNVPADGQATLDCRGLSYCATGRVRAPGGVDPGPSFTGALTPDTTPGPGGPQLTLYPLATASQINSGDLLIEHTATGETPATLNVVFNTTPALTSWTSSAGQAGSVAYPAGPGAPGTRDNPFTVSAGTDGNVVLDLTAWRPQRRAIPGAGEGTGFMDIGHLQWQTRLVTQPTGPGGTGGTTVIDCPGGYTDPAADAPANPANTVPLSLNLTACLASKAAAWTTGQSIQLEIAARAQGGDNSSQQVFFRLG